MPASSFNSRAGLAVNISINRGRSIDLPFVNEQVDENPELGFQSNNPKRRAIELDFLFELCVRRVIARENFDRAVGDSLQQRVDVALRPQRRIHFVVRIEILNRFIRQRDVMRTDFAADFYAARPRFAQNRTLPAALMCWQ